MESSASLQLTGYREKGKSCPFQTPVPQSWHRSAREEGEQKGKELLSSWKTDALETEGITVIAIYCYCH